MGEGIGMDKLELGAAMRGGFLGGERLKKERGKWLKRIED